MVLFRRLIISCQHRCLLRVLPGHVDGKERLTARLRAWCVAALFRQPRFLTDLMCLFRALHCHLHCHGAWSSERQATWKAPRTPSGLLHPSSLPSRPLTLASSAACV